MLCARAVATHASDESALAWLPSFPPLLRIAQVGCAWIGKNVVSLGLNGDLSLIDEAAGKPRGVLQGHSVNITAMAARPRPDPTARRMPQRPSRRRRRRRLRSGARRRPEASGAWSPAGAGG